MINKISGTQIASIKQNKQMNSNKSNVSFGKIIHFSTVPTCLNRILPVTEEEKLLSDLAYAPLGFKDLLYFIAKDEKLPERIIYSRPGEVFVAFLEGLSSTALEKYTEIVKRITKGNEIK